MIRKLLFVIMAILAVVTAGCSGNGSGTETSNEGKPKSAAKLVGTPLIVSGTLPNVSGNYTAGSPEDQQNPRVLYLQDRQLYFTVWEDWSNRLTTGADVYAQFSKEDGTVCGPSFAVNNAAGNQTVPAVAYKPGGNILVAWQDTTGSTAGGYVLHTNFTPPLNPGVCAAYAGPGALAATQVGFNPRKMNTVTYGTLPVVTNEVLGTGNGATRSYISSTSQLPVANSITVALSDGSVTLTDNGSGLLTGVGGAGSVNYLTGSVKPSFTAAPADGVSIIITYTYRVINNSYTSNVNNPDDGLASRKMPVAQYDNVRDEFLIAWVESRTKINSLDIVAFPGSQLATSRITWEFGDTSFAGYVRLNGGSFAEKTSLLSPVTGADIIRNYNYDEQSSTSTTGTSRFISGTGDGITLQQEYEFFTDVTSVALAVDSTSPEALFIVNAKKIKGDLDVKCDDKNADKACEYGEGVTSTFVENPADSGATNIYFAFAKDVSKGVVKLRSLDNDPLTGKAVATDSSHPAAVFDPITKRFLVAWEDTRNGSNTKIYGQLINSGAGLYNSNINITGSVDAAVTGSKQTAPAITYDGVNQRFFIAWQDGRNSTFSYENLDIYGQYLDAEGSLRGDNYFISTDNSNQYAPSIAYSTGANQFFAIWKDARNTSVTGSDIYGQLFSLGQPHIGIFKTDGTILSPPLLDFGGVPMGTAKTMQFVIKNTGDAALVIDPITQIGDPFRIAPTNGVTLAPGASTTLTATYSPTASGTNNSSVTIRSDGGTLLVSLIGVGTGTDPLQIKTASLPDGSPNQVYPTTTLTGFGGSYPYTWGETGGVLASIGLAIDANTGVISGTIGAAVTPKTYDVSITLTDQTGLAISKALTLNIGLISIKTLTLNSASTGVLFNQQLEYVGGTAPVSWSNTGTLPAGLTLSPTGVLSGIPTADGSFTFDITVTDANSAQSTRTFTMLIQSPLNITSSAVADMTVDTLVSFTFQATGGSLPYKWSLTGGAFPAGITAFDVNGGNLSGTPTTVGHYSFEITVTDKLGATSSKLYSVNVSSPVTITTTSLVPWTVNSPVAYSQALTITGGTAPYSWAESAGVLASLGLSIDGTTGVISGTPTKAGTFNFTVTATDSAATAITASKQLSIVINQAMTITTPSISSATVGSIYSQPMTIFGGTAPVFWSASGLPAGMTIDSATGTVFGIPTAITPTPAVPSTITATDASGASVQRSFSFNVYGTIAVTQPITVNNAVVGTSYTINLAATGGRAPYSWSVTGALPPGLTLGTGTGVVSGKPTTAGVYTFTVSVQDPDSRKDSVALTVLVLDPVTVTTTSLSSWTANQPGYNQAVLGSGGLGNLSWAVTAGSLPAGLSLNAATGQISGTPTTGGTYPFTLQATDTSVPALTGQKQLSISIKQPVFALSNSVPDAVIGSGYLATLSATSGTLPYTWTVSTGLATLSNLGLLLDPATGAISGTPIALTTVPAAFTVTATDAAGSAVNLPLTINVVGPLAIATNTLPSVDKGSAYTQSLTGSGGSAPYTWSVSSGSLPAGVTLDANTGVLSGTPTAGGTYTFVVTLTDNAARTASKTLTITVNDILISGSFNFYDQSSALLSNNTLSFGTVLKSSVVTKQFNLVNSGTQPVSITSMVLSDSSFNAVLPQGVLIQPGIANAVPVTVTFIPSSAVSYSATLKITDSNGAQSILNLVGTGSTVSVSLAGGSSGTVTSFGALAQTQLPLTSKPSNLTISNAAQMRIDGVTPGATVTINIAFDSLPANPVFYKVVGSTWTAFTPIISGNIITYDVADNGPFDSDPTAGVIVDPVVVGSTSTTGGTGGTGGTPGNGSAAPAAVSSGSSSGCFIATAAYGSYLDPHVKALRDFRDDVLLQNRFGTAFVKFYYKYSPPIADYIAQHGTLRLIFRFLLTPVILLVKLGWISPGILILALAARLYRSHRNRALTAQLISKSAE